MKMNVDRSNVTQVIHSLNVSLSGTVSCYSGTINTNNGLIVSDNPLTQAVSIFIKQLSVILFVSRCIVLFLSRLHLPSLLVELLGVFVAGPFVLGRWEYFTKWLLPTTNLLTWSTVAQMGLMFHAFIAGLESDMKAVSNPSDKAFTVAVVGMAVPFIAGFGLFYLAGGYLIQPSPHGDIMSFSPFKNHEHKVWIHRGATFCGAALASTEFSSVTQALAGHKLLHSEIGRTAMGAAMITEIVTWIVLGIGVSLSLSFKALGYVILCGAPLWYFCHRVLGPMLAWLVVKVSDGKPEITEARASVAVGIALLGGFAANMAGLHPMVGAYLVGQGVPHRLLRNTLVEKFDYVISGIIMPMVFGNLVMMIDPVCFTRHARIRFKFLRFVGVCVVAGAAKLGAVATVARFQKLSIRDSITLGTVLSNKNALSIILIFIGIVVPEKGT